MLTFLVHRGKEYTFRHYLKTWGAPLAGRVAVRNYPGLGTTGKSFAKRLERRLKSLRTGTLSLRSAPPPDSVFAFTDLEILADWERRRVERIASRLQETPEVRVLNQPARALTRFELLDTLHEAGVNSFGVRRAGSTRTPDRFPVYVRDDRSHDDGSMSELLDPEALGSHLADLTARGVDLGSRTIVEYAGEPGPDGLFRKYAAMRLGDAIIPCHIFFGRQWVVKHSEVFDESTAREELEYVETNPHEVVLRRAFELARIEYGRADYGVVDGRVEIWEINTNPYVIRPEYTRQEARREVLAAFAERFNRAVEGVLALP